MATLQKFKLLATQCSTIAAATSPSRSPTTTSPVLHLRRRRTLKMFLTRSGSNRRREDSSMERKLGVEDNSSLKQQQQQQGVVISNKLKDLFVSSSPPLNENGSEGVGIRDDDREALIERVRRTIGRRGGRSLSAAFRYRLLRRPWRPVLFTIPE